MRKAKKRFKIIILIAIILLVIICYLDEKRCEADMAREWNMILVNDDYYLSDGYQVELWELQNGERVDARIYPYLQEMIEAAEKEDIYMFVADGYRSKEEQEQIMNEKVKEYKEKIPVEFIAKYMAKKWVAVPGTSEHQLGLAVDINADIYNYGWEVYSWLDKHAHEYGFIQRYPEDKTRITGISYEPWHYRFVGIEAATEMYEKNLCLEEYVDSLE